MHEVYAAQHDISLDSLCLPVSRPFSPIDNGGNGPCISSRDLKDLSINDINQLWFNDATQSALPAKKDTRTAPVVADDIEDAEYNLQVLSAMMSI